MYLKNVRKVIATFISNNLKLMRKKETIIKNHYFMIKDK